MAGVEVRERPSVGGERKHDELPVTTVDTGFDGLTGVGSWSRSGWAVFAWGPRRPFAAIAVGLTGFRGINDRLCHLVGDEALRQVARRIGSVVPPVPDSYIGRTGGDTFLVLAALPVADAARLLAEQIVAAIEAPLQIGEATIHVEARAALLMATKSPPAPGTVDIIEVTRNALKAMPRDGTRVVLVATPADPLG